MHFTAEEAFEASDIGDPIYITRRAAWRIVTAGDYDAQGFDALFVDGCDSIDAAKLLAWLGF